MDSRSEDGSRSDGGEHALFATLSLLSKKWTPRVVLALSEEGALGFSDLQSALPGVSGKVLTQTLDALVDASVVERRVVTESPLRVEYSLTDAGSELESTFADLAAWGERYLEEDVPELVVADEDRRLTALFERWFDSTYAVRRVHDVEALLDAVDSGTTVVLFDAHLSGAGAASVPQLLRPVASECRFVALVTGRIDVDLIDVDADASLRKPATKAELADVIETQIDRYGESPAAREYHRLLETRHTLEANASESVLAADERYVDLCARTEALAEDRVPTDGES